MPRPLAETTAGRFTAETAVVRKCGISYSAVLVKRISATHEIGEVDVNGSTSALFRHQAWILLAAGLVFFTNLGAYPLFDEDEPKNAVCGKEMYERGDWIVPTFNHDLRTDKPILIYWVMLTSFHLFGVSELTARLGSALLSAGTLLLTYHLGRRLFDAQTGFLAGLILCTCLMFSAVGRSVTPDATLICCTTSALTAYVWMVSRRQGGRFGMTEDAAGRRMWTGFLPATRRESVLMYGAMGLAVLAKGPVGVVLPCAIIGLFLLVRWRGDRLSDGAQLVPGGGWWRSWPVAVWQTVNPARVGFAAWKMRVLFGAAVVAVVALPWYTAVGIQTDGAWLAGFLGRHNVGRFLEPMENHRGPVIYYIPVVLLGTFPWSVFLPVAVWRLVQRIREGGPDVAASTFLACWAGLWIAFFSFAQTKLPNYVLPSYPALALIVASYLRDWLREADPAGSFIFRLGCRVLGVVGLLMLIGLPIGLHFFLPAERWLGVLGLIPLLGAGFAYGCLQQRRPRLALRGLAVMAVVLAVGITSFASTRVGRHLEAPLFAAAARQVAGTESPELVTYEYFTPSLVYYVGGRVNKLYEPAEVGRYLSDHPAGFVLTREDRLPKLEPLLPEGVKVLARQPRFLRRHELVILGRGTRQVASGTGVRPF